MILLICFGGYVNNCYNFLIMLIKYLLVLLEVEKVDNIVFYVKVKLK